MSIDTTDYVEITIKYSFGGAECANVFHYVAGDDGLTALDCIEAFEQQMLPVMRNMMTGAAIIYEIACRNLFDPSERDSKDYQLPGLLGSGGEQMPPQLSNSFRLVHDNPTVRQGAKRVAGISELSWVNENQTDGSLNNANAAFISQVASIIFNPNDGVGAWLIPIVIGRIQDGLGGYRLPESLVEAGIAGAGLIIQALWRGFTGQDSRKNLAVL